LTRKAKKKKNREKGKGLLNGVNRVRHAENEKKKVPYKV